MVKINYAELRFDHVVVFKQDDTIFACSRENGKGKLRIFLAFGNGKGRVYTRNGQTESWEILESPDAETVRQQIRQATNEGIATYRLNGSSHLASEETIQAPTATA